MTCSSCGAAMATGAQWCGQCFAPGSPVPPAAAGRFVPAAEAPRRPPVLSRWRKTDTTFGPWGRSCWTLGVLLLAVVFVFSANPFAIGGWDLVAAPLILRSVWAAGRVS